MTAYQTDALLLLAYDIALWTLLGVLLAIVVDFARRDLAAARHDRRRIWHGR